MSKRKGVSYEEKRSRMVEIFHESQDIFTLKELEKIAPKQKGIISQAVKEVLQSVVDDNLVDTDKIGTSNYFWSLPSKTLNILTTRKNELTAEVEHITSNNKKLKVNIKEASGEREDNDERVTLTGQLARETQEHNELKSTLAKYADNDPDFVKGLEEDAETAKDASNRWTDNVFQLKQYVVNKFNIESDVFDKEAGIKDDFDYVE